MVREQEDVETGKMKLSTSAYLASALRPQLPPDNYLILVASKS